MQLLIMQEGKQAGNASKKSIGFSRQDVSGFSAGSTHIDFKMIDCPLNHTSDFVSFFPLIRIPLNPGVYGGQASKRGNYTLRI